MHRSFRTWLGRAVPGCVALALIALSACSNSLPAGQAAGSASRALPAAGAELVFPSWAGYGGNLIVPANDAPAGTNVKISSFNMQPPGAPFPQSVARRALGPNLHRDEITPAGGTVIFWVSLRFTQAVTFSNFPQVTFTLPGSVSPTATVFSVELLDQATGELLNEWTAPTIAGPALTFAAPTGPGLDAATQDTYWFELISTPAAAPTPTPTGPTPSPSPTAVATPTPPPTPTPTPAGPTPTPSPSPSATPALIVLSPTAGAVGNNGGCPPVGPASYTFTATEAGYSGNFTAVAPVFSPHQPQFTVSPASVGNGGTFTVTDSNPSVAVGVWQISVSDSLGNTTTESVTSVTCLE